MTWTKTQERQLTDACMVGMCDANIARYFGIPIEDVTAKREEMGLTLNDVIRKRKARAAARRRSKTC